MNKKDDPKGETRGKQFEQVFIYEKKYHGTLNTQPH